MKNRKKKIWRRDVILRIGGGIFLSGALLACGNHPEEAPALPTETPIQAGAPEMGTEPSREAIFPEERLASLEESLDLDHSLRLHPTDGLFLYLKEDARQLQAVMKYCHNDRAEDCQILDWDYNLDYGKPIYGEIKKESGRECFVVVPTEELTEPLSPIGAYEICGKAYIFELPEKDADTLQIWEYQNINPEDFLEESVAGYYENEEGKMVFALTLQLSKPYWGWGGRYEYPDLQLPKQDEYLIVFEEVSHYTDTWLEYRRVGVQAKDGVTWLGKFCIDLNLEGRVFSDYSHEYYAPIMFFPESGLGYDCWDADGAYSWVETDGMLADEAWQKGRPCRMEPDVMLDLDNDGVLEKVSYRKTGQSAVITADGMEVLRETIHTYETFAGWLYVASLDKKNLQVLLLDYAEGRSEILHIYQYADGMLRNFGEFPSRYHVEEIGGRNIYSAFLDVFPLQNSLVEEKYEFTDQGLQKIEQDYYEFGRPEFRNALTVRQDISLHKEKGEAETFLLSVGSKVKIIGGDQKEWILFENCGTGEQGWMRVKWEDDLNAAFDCILPDGSEVPAGELLEGLIIFN